MKEWFLGDGKNIREDEPKPDSVSSSKIWGRDNTLWHADEKVEDIFTLTGRTWFGVNGDWPRTWEVAINKDMVYSVSAD